MKISLPFFYVYLYNVFYHDSFDVSKYRFKFWHCTAVPFPFHNVFFHFAKKLLKENPNFSFVIHCVELILF